MQSLQTFGREVRQGESHRRQFSQRTRQSQQVTRVRRLQRDAAEQALQVEDALHRAAQFFPRDQVAYHALDGIEALIDFGKIDRRSQHPRPQQALAHRCHRAIETAEQRCTLARAGEQWLDQFQVAHGNGVQYEAVLPLVEADAVHVIERATLRGANVVKYRARRSCRRRTVRQAKALQRQYAKVVFDLRNGVVRREDPVVQRSLCPGSILKRSHTRRRSGRRRRCNRARLIEQRQRRSEQHFAWTQHQQLLTDTSLGIFALELSRAKFAGRKIERRKSYGIPGTRDAAQEIVLLGAEMRVGGGPRREHPRDLALHQFLGDSRVLHLLADGHLESFANEFGDIVLGRVIWDAAHGHGYAFFLVARGQRDLELAGGDDRVLEEELVEIAQAKEDERIGMFFFYRGILPHQWRGRLAHRRNCADYKPSSQRARGDRCYTARFFEAIISWRRSFRSNAADAARSSCRRQNQRFVPRMAGHSTFATILPRFAATPRATQSLLHRRACGAMRRCCPMLSL